MAVVYNINANQTIEDVFKIVLVANLDLLKKSESVALDARDDEGVHQMRVSLRRMRSLVYIHKPILPKRVTHTLSNEMHYVGLELDFARDLDVYISEHFNEKILSSIEKLMYGIAKKHKLIEYKKVSKLINSSRFKKFHISLSNWIEKNAWKEFISNKKQKKFEGNIIPFAIEVLEKNQSKLKQAGSNIDELDDESLHKLRILGKKLRYTTDFFAPLFDKKLNSFTSSLKKIQDLLGLLHDYSITQKIHKSLLRGQENKELYKFTNDLELKQQEESVEIKRVLHIEWGKFIQFKQPWF